MGKPTGFLEHTRVLPGKRDPKERINDYKELYVYDEYGEDKVREQASRCMDCGVPFCHQGCPLGNIIPEFNDAVYRGDWETAYNVLSSTNNFPEFTGRICPAPCEASCVLAINQPAVTIEEIEKNIIETAWARNLVKPRKPSERTGKKVAVVGSGPAGLAAAAQLNSAGHWVTVLERDDAIGGLLRFGIPDFKLEKWVVERRVKLMEEEGVRFQTHANVGVNVNVNTLLYEYDAIVLTGGSTIPRDLPVPGRDLKGVHFAMDFLRQQNKRVSHIPFNEEDILAEGKNVIVIGGGDTGSDCVGTSIRQGAKSVTQIELLTKPPEGSNPATPWPNWPMILRTSTSHEEGCERAWCINTREFLGDEEGNLRALKIVQVDWKATEPGKPMRMVEIPGTEEEIPCELVLIAAGFVHPQHSGMLDELETELDERGNVKSTDYRTSVEKVFVAGDMRRGQSLVVWAIAEGREAAYQVDKYLQGSSRLECRDVSQVHLEPIL